uniref:Mitochondrial carrier protein n=1 Tax=Gongylonema pulchrum TaxID=637853 RepID=A0A183CXA6_9BILA
LSVLKTRLRGMPDTEKYRNFIAGCGAGMAETLILYPKSKVIFRQQIYGTTTKTVLKQMRDEGFWMLYRGVLMPLLQRTTTRSIMFGIFNRLNEALGCAQCRTPQRRIICSSSAAFLAGTSEAVLCPLERTQVLMQAREFNRHYKNTLDALSSLAKACFKLIYFYDLRNSISTLLTFLGVAELYRGLSLILLRNGLSNTVFFNLREPLRDVILSDYNRSIHLRIPVRVVIFVSNFASGAILGAFISTLFFPVNVVKQRMQITVGTPFRSPVHVFRIIWKERNGSVRQFFRGGALNFTRSLFTWGITNATYEVLRYLLSKNLAK